MTTGIRQATALMAVALLLAGCSMAPLQASEPGQVAVYVRDAPSDEFVSVFVTIERVEVDGPVGPTGSVNGTSAETRSGGWTLVVNESHTIDLMQFQGPERSFLGAHPLPAGTYAQVRLWIGRAYGIDGNGTVTNITVATEDPRIVQDWSVGAHQETQLTIDFDLEAGLKDAEDGQVVLEPALILTVAHGNGPSGDDLPSDASGSPA